MIDVLPWHQGPLTGLLARREKLPHALLIHGNQGIGKVDFARAMAQSLLCEAPISGEARAGGIACGVCDACNWFRDGNHPDYRELLPEILVDDDVEAEGLSDPDVKDKKKSKEIKIDQIRAIADFMTLSTHRDGFRVLVIHPAEAMNMSAANALLKTLEEPSARTVILLVTDQMARLMATIRSRCQRVLLPAPENLEAVTWLQQHGTGLNAAQAESALAMAGGSPLDAVTFAAAEYQTARKAFVAALSDPAADYMAAAQSFEKSDLNHIVTWLQTWVSDVVLSKMSGNVRHHVDEKQSIANIARHVQLTKLFRYESALRQARRSIHHPLNVRLLLEQLLISYQRAVK